MVSLERIATTSLLLIAGAWAVYQIYKEYQEIKQDKYLDRIREKGL